MRTIVTLVLVFLIAGPVIAQDDDAAAAGPTATAIIAAGVENREPVDAGETFLATIGKLYCWSRVTGATAGTSVDHVWYHEDAEVSRVTLDVGGATWRTWSSKTIAASATGSWRVDVEAGGTVVGSVSFSIR